MRRNQNFEIDFGRGNHASYHLRLSIFSIFFSALPFFSSSYLFAAVVGLLQASFEWKNFRESVNEAQNIYHGQAYGGKGIFSSEFFH